MKTKKKLLISIFLLLFLFISLSSVSSQNNNSFGEVQAEDNFDCYEIISEYLTNEKNLDSLSNEANHNEIMGKNYETEDQTDKHESKIANDFPYEDSKLGEDGKTNITSIIAKCQSSRLGKNGTISLDLSSNNKDLLEMNGTATITLYKEIWDDESLIESIAPTNYTFDVLIDSDGKGSISLGESLPDNTYIIYIKYIPNNENFNAIIEDTPCDEGELFIVESKLNIFDVNLNVNSIPEKKDTTFNVTVTSYENYTLYGTVTICIYDNWEKNHLITKFTIKIDENGYGNIVKGKELSKGNYWILLNYSGNNYYKEYEIEYPFKVYSLEKTITKNNVKFSSQTKKVKKSKANKAKFKITLKTSNKKVLAKKLVYIKINKKTYKATTNKKGVATFKLKLPKVKKTYKYTVTFKGDKANNKKTYKGKLAVK